eukprot:s1_g2599.t1
MLSPAYAEGNGNVAWAGVNFTDDSIYYFIGGMMDFDGDLGTSGGVLRAHIAGGQYDYTNGNVAGNNVDGDQYSLDLLVGYRMVDENQTVAIYAGVAAEDHDLSPNDTSNNVNGDEYGAKILLDTNFNTKGDLGIDFNASYSTVFDTYYSSLTLPYRFDGFSIGPEVVALGNEQFDQQRFGAAASIDIGGFKLGVDGGLAVGGRDSDNSAYGGVVVSTVF